MSRARLGSVLVLIGVLLVVGSAAVVVLPRITERQAKAEQRKRALAAAVRFIEQADSVSLRSHDGQSLGTVSKASQPKVWQALVDDIRRGDPGEEERQNTQMPVELRRDGQLFVHGLAYPPRSQLTLCEAGWVTIRVSQLVNQELERCYRKMLAQPNGQPSGSPSAKAAPPSRRSYRPGAQALRSGGPPRSASPPQLPQCDEVKGNLVRLFRDCVYVNVQGMGRDTIAVDTTREGREPWQRMVSAIEQGSRGRAIPGQPEVVLLCETNQTLAMPTEIHYSKGMLSGSDAKLGADVIAVQVGPRFDKALEALCAIGIEHWADLERERQ